MPTHQTGTTSLPGLNWTITKELAGQAKIPDGMMMALYHQKTNKIVKNIRLSYAAHGEVPVREIEKILQVVRQHLQDIDWTLPMADLLRDKSITDKMKALDAATKDVASKVEKKVIMEELEGGLIWNSRRDEQWWKRRKPTSFDTIEKVDEADSSNRAPDHATEIFMDDGGMRMNVSAWNPISKQMVDQTIPSSPIVPFVSLAALKTFAARNNIDLSKAKKGHLAEDVAANHAGGDPNPNVAGLDEPFRKKPRDKFMGHHVFEVDAETFAKSVKGKPKWARYKNYMSLEDFPNIGQEIKEYAYRNPGKSIILKETRTGRMLYLKGFKQ